MQLAVYTRLCIREARIFPHCDARHDQSAIYPQICVAFSYSSYMTSHVQCIMFLLQKLAPTYTHIYNIWYIACIKVWCAICVHSTLFAARSLRYYIIYRAPAVWKCTAVPTHRHTFSHMCIYSLYMRISWRERERRSWQKDAFSKVNIFAVRCAAVQWTRLKVAWAEHAKRFELARKLWYWDRYA